MRIKAQNRTPVVFGISVSAVLLSKWIYLLLLINSAKAHVPGTLASRQCSIFNVF